MPIYRRKAESSEMNRVKRYVAFMTRSMKFDENMDKVNWSRLRMRHAVFYRIMSVQKGVKFKKMTLGGVPVLRHKYMDGNEDHVFIYIHGGGFVTGSAFDIRSYSSTLSKYSGSLLYSIEYALAPEHAFPTALDQCSSVLEEAMSLHPKARFTLAGESAGGNFCAALALKYKDTGRIASLILNSPTLDFSGAVDHDMNTHEDNIVSKGAGDALRRIYVGDHDPEDPMISPILGDFTGFPPTFITCDVNETLYADSLSLYEKLQQAGIPSVLIEMEGAFHAYGTAGNSAPETSQILGESLLFVKEHM